jgi:hypothetical protein
MHRVLAQELGSLAQCVVPCPRLAIQMKFFVRSSGTAVLIHHKEWCTAVKNMLAFMLCRALPSRRIACFQDC